MSKKIGWQKYEDMIKKQISSLGFFNDDSKPRFESRN